MFLPMALSYLLNIIGSYNGLVPNRQHAITWSNDDIVHWHMISVITMDYTHWFPIPLVLLHVLVNGPSNLLNNYIDSSRLTSWWLHQIETFSTLLAHCGGIHRSPVNSPHKGQWRGALMFSLLCAWTNGWVNNWNAGDLRRHRARCDVTLMIPDIRRQGYAISMVAASASI